MIRLAGWSTAYFNLGPEVYNGMHGSERRVAKLFRCFLVVLNVRGVLSSHC